jgi:predicted O-methyltransferase YrrM
VIDWLDDEVFVLRGATFRAAPLALERSTPERLVLAKPRWLVEEYVRIARECPNPNVFELGINKGGSTAFLAELFRPRTMVAIDLAEEPVDVLTEFLARRRLCETVHPLFGVDQGDSERLLEILQAHFGDEPLDLVVDDASHLLGATTASFNILFPRVRPGGIFILEDWSWDHTWERVFTADPERFGDALHTIGDRPALSRLVVELVLVTGYAPEVVAQVDVRNGLVSVRRGDQPVEAAEFELSKYYGDAGRRVVTSEVGERRTVNATRTVRCPEPFVERVKSLFRRSHRIDDAGTA